MSKTVELQVQLPYAEARALATLLARLTTEESRRIAQGWPQMQAALDGAQRLHWELIGALAESTAGN